MSNRIVKADAGDSIRDVAGNLLVTSGNNSRIQIANRHLSGVVLDTSLRGDVVLEDRVVSTLPGEQIPLSTFDPRRIKGLSRWLDAGDSKTLFSDPSCTMPLGRGESFLGCWSDKSGRGDHYIPVLSMDWPTLFDVLVAEEEEGKSRELFVVKDHKDKVDILSFVYPYPSLEEETSDHLGEIREVVIYERVLGESDRAELEGYMACRWQLLPTTEGCL